MSKEARATIRMSEELDAWVQAEASKREMDKAAFIRLVLAERKTGVDHPLFVATPAPIARDVLDVGTRVHPLPDAQWREAQPSDMRNDLVDDVPLFNVDDLVNDALEHADAQGLTAHRPREEDMLMEEAGARSLSRSPIRYSPGAGPAHLRNI